MKYPWIFLLSILGTLGAATAQDSLLVAVAEKGDGIFSLLRKHVNNPYEYYEEFLTLNEGNLRDSIFLFEGNRYLIPNSNDSVPDHELSDTLKLVTEEKPVAGIEYAIFGEKYALIPSQSKRLENTVFYVISGHGGPDPGAMTTYAGTAISEDEYAYDVSLRLARELLSHGAMVYVIIRDPDDGIRDDRILPIDRDEVNYPNETIPLNQLERLKQRVNTVNELYKQHKGKHQRLIVTHVDSRSQGQNIDVFFYHHHKSKNGKKFAENIHETFKEKYARFQPNRVYSGTFEDRSSLYLVKKTYPPMTFIEIGNISNSKDQRRILDPDNRQALAKWISEGALRDYENQ